MPKITIGVKEITSQTTTTIRHGTATIRVPSGTRAEEIPKFCDELEEAGDLSIKYIPGEVVEPSVETTTTIYTCEDEEIR